jgi:phosphatidylserine decarboxylase
MIERSVWPIITVLGFMVVIGMTVNIILSALFFFGIIFTLFFFRDPDRQPAGTGAVSPADGKVKKVEGNKVEIFMNLLDCHVNRVPWGGTVTKIIYYKGSFFPAFRDDIEENERNEVIISTDYGELTVTQIAGFFARRITCYLSKGQKVRKGDRLGMIRFGSRVHVHFPRAFRIIVKEGDRVKAGETIIAVVES